MHNFIFYATTQVKRSFREITNIVIDCYYKPICQIMVMNSSLCFVIIVIIVIIVITPLLVSLNSRRSFLAHSTTSLLIGVIVEYNMIISMMGMYIYISPHSSFHGNFLRKKSKETKCPIHYFIVILIVYPYCNSIHCHCFTIKVEFKSIKNIYMYIHNTVLCMYEV